MSCQIWLVSWLTFLAVQTLTAKLANWLADVLFTVMDREAYRNCCSLVKIPRQTYEQFWSSHFVDYIDKELSYSKFFKKYLLPNYPCMFSRRFTEDWKCRKQWVTEEGKPNFQKLLQDFGK